LTRATRALALVTGLLVAGAARADGKAALELTTQDCPDIDEARLRELLGIELATVRPAGAGDVIVRLACEGARVVVDLRDRGLERTWRTEVDLTTTPEATRLRLLVLAVTEQWSLPRAEPPPVVAPPVAPESAPTIVRAPTPPAEPTPWRLSAKAALRGAGKPGVWLGGAGLGLERALGRRLGLTLDVVAEQGSLDAAVASVTARDLVATAGLSLGADAGRWSFAAIPAFAVGLASLSATPHAADARGATLDAAWAGPELAARVRRSIGRGASVVAEAGVGTTTRRVTGLVDGQTPLFELTGPWLELGLGAGWAF
jgi:hypothetical protein